MLLLAFYTGAAGPAGAAGHHRRRGGIGNPISGLNLTVTIKTPAGSVNTLRVAASQVVDNGDGDYSADYTASDLGLGYPPLSFHTPHTCKIDAPS